MDATTRRIIENLREQYRNAPEATNRRFAAFMSKAHRLYSWDEEPDLAEDRRSRIARAVERCAQRAAHIYEDAMVLGDLGSADMVRIFDAILTHGDLRGAEASLGPRPPSPHAFGSDQARR